MTQATALATIGVLLLTTFSGPPSRQNSSIVQGADDRANRRASRSNRSQPKPCGPGKTTIETGSAKKLNAHVTSDNKIQLKFRTKQYVGEFFRYTRDLFLIYKSARLARLTCSPA
jgi:hypothetical protein